MAKATGIGGVFFRSPDPQATADWYRDHLGLELEADHHVSVVRWNGGETTVWSPFDADTEYFGGSGQEFMVNFRVDDLDELMLQLTAAGVVVAEETEQSEFGYFGWCVDCDGRRIELWQPPEGS